MNSSSNSVGFSQSRIVAFAVTSKGGRTTTVKRELVVAVALSLAVGTFGCSFKGRAVSALVDVLGDAETVYLSDGDPELVAAALPFNLKTVETLLVSSPENRELLLSAAKGFSLYAYAFVEPETRTVPYTEFERAEAIRARAAAMYRRAYDYGLRGIEVDHPGLRDRLIVDPYAAAAGLSENDLALAVWTAASLGGAIGVSKDDPESTADVEVVGALLERALELDEDFDHGTIHEFLLTYEASRVGGSRDKALQHYERALQLGASKRPAIWLSWAETISVSEQNRDEFLELVEKALEFDVHEFPRNRLLNVLAQRRARWLRANVDELFLTDDES